MDRLRAPLEPAHMQTAVGKVDGVPPQRDELARPQPVPVGDQHHGGIAVAVAVLPGRGDQAIDFGVGQILARADSSVALTAGWPMGDCPIKVVGATSARCGFVMSFEAFPCATVPNKGSYGTLHKARNADFGLNFGSGSRTVLGGHFRRWATDGTMADCDSPARFFLRRKRFHRPAGGRNFFGGRSLEERGALIVLIALIFLFLLLSV